jgi:hypothetical protein
MSVFAVIERRLRAAAAAEYAAVWRQILATVIAEGWLATWVLADESDPTRVVIVAEVTTRDALARGYAALPLSVREAIDALIAERIGAWAQWYRAGRWVESYGSRPAAARAVDFRVDQADQERAMDWLRSGTGEIAGRSGVLAVGWLVGEEDPTRFLVLAKLATEVDEGPAGPLLANPPVTLHDQRFFRGGLGLDWPSDASAPSLDPLLEPGDRAIDRLGLGASEAVPGPGQDRELDPWVQADDPLEDRERP